MPNTDECMNQLLKVKNLKKKTAKFEEKKCQVKNLCFEIEDEGNRLKEYHDEMQLLLQEKMAHVEELRLIHTDINVMEGIIKQSSLDKISMINQIEKFANELSLLEEEINSFREDLGLKKMENSMVDESVLVEKIKKTNFNTKMATNNHQNSLSEICDSNQMITMVTGSVSQLPPMKSCLSCHQQIHRNAPICPLCKAKSRSRNPKKSKKQNKIEE